MGPHYNNHFRLRKSRFGVVSCSPSPSESPALRSLTMWIGSSPTVSPSSNLRAKVLGWKFHFSPFGQIRMTASPMITFGIRQLSAMWSAMQSGGSRIQSVNSLFGFASTPPPRLQCGSGYGPTTSSGIVHRLGCVPSSMKVPVGPLRDFSPLWN